MNDNIVSIDEIRRKIGVSARKIEYVIVAGEIVINTHFNETIPA